MKSLLILILIQFLMVVCFSQQQQENNGDNEEKVGLGANMQIVNAFNFVRRYFKNRETYAIKKMIEVWRKNGTGLTYGKKKQPDRLIGR
jgi:hypothetical protein